DSALDVSWFRALVSLGVNRLSLGVQSLADQWLAALGRPHSAAQAVESYFLARKAGFANISLDFIWGLPGQTSKQWLEQLKRVKEMGPEHLSCYGLTVEPGTPLAADVAGGLELPPEQEQARMFVYGAEYLEAQGWLQYEISNFARMGYTSRHNQGYWEQRDYLGLGPSAVSTLGDRRYANPRFLDEYDAAVRGGALAELPEVLDAKTRLEELVMLSLRTTRGLDLREHRRRAGFDLMKTHAGLIQALHQNRLIRIKDGRLSLTKEGMAVSTVIMERLALAEG
ncbi:MAG: coproporphyrinogen-III oxidase family protein, partial [Desulfovibrionaceae bacterium]